MALRDQDEVEAKFLEFEIAIFFFIVTEVLWETGVPVMYRCFVLVYGVVYKYMKGCSHNGFSGCLILLS